MKLYIQVESGAPLNHPALEDTLIHAFGEIPNNWEPFVRVEKPTLTDKTIVLVQPEPVYQKINGVWQDVWLTRPKTAEELAAEKQDRLKFIRGKWANRPYPQNFTAWVLNEELERYESPIPRPDDGKFYRWHGPTNNWKETEPFPQDGKRYYFDFDNWLNVEM